MRNYADSAYRAFRYAVKNRDKKKCRWPGCTCKKKLQVHHILPWAKFPHLRCEVANGITLCKKHHASIKGKELFFVKLFTGIING